MKSAATPDIPSLYNDIVAFPASRVDDALAHLMAWLQRELDLDNVTWLGSLLMLEENVASADPLLGWRIRARRVLMPDTEAYRRLVDSYYRSEHYGNLTPTFYRGKHRPETDVHVGATMRALVADAGKFRACRLRDGWIDFARFRRTEHYRLYYSDLGITDRMWIVFPLNDHTESIFLLDRHRRDAAARRRNFSDRDTTLATAALGGQREFHRRLLLVSGVLRGVKTLSPLKLRILRELLSGRPEKEIAFDLSQNPATLRKTITELYREFRVTTRPALMALWLGEG